MHTIRRSILIKLILLTAASTPGIAGAQTSGSLSSSYDLVLTRFESQFVAVAKAMPSSEYDFNPGALTLPRAEFKGVRTFAEEVKHVAEMNFVIYSVMSGLKPDIDMDSIGRLKSKDEILSALTQSFAFGHKAIGTLTLSNASDTPEDSHGMTRAGIAAYVMVHDADHYGQLSEYLRMNGIIPPQSRK